MGVGITSLLGWPGLTRGRWRGTPYSHVLGAPCWGSATLVLGWTRGPVRSLHALRGQGAAQEVAPEGWRVEGKEHGPRPFSSQAGFETQGNHLRTPLNP